MNFLFNPVPNMEATDFISSKPVVTREVFDKLLPELKARAFLVTGVEVAGVLQSVRDTIASLPAGGDWNTIKKSVVDEIHPFLADPSDPDNTTAAERRAELLIRTHGQQAYAVSQNQVMDRHRDVFPYWQYQTMEDSHVRDSHQALDGLVLPADSPFWEGHTPPWDYGCRCHLIPLQKEDVDQIQEDEKNKPVDEQSVPDATRTQMLEQGRMMKGGATIDLRTPLQKGEGYTFNPGDLRLSPEQLKDRYDAPIWSAFAAWAKTQEIEKGRTVWEWMEGKSASTTPTPAPISSPTHPHADLSGLVTSLAANPDHITTEEAEKIIEAIRNLHSHGANANDWLAAFDGRNMSKKLLAEWRKMLFPIFEDFIKILPGHLLNKIHPIQIVMRHLSSAQGQFDPYSHVLSLDPLKLSGSPWQQRETFFHELAHWMHLTGTDEYRKVIADHFDQRTAGETVVHLPDYPADCKGKRDRFWDSYMGRVYPGIPDGCEIPSRTFELLQNAREFKEKWNDSTHRETINLVFSVLFQQPNTTP